MNIKSQTHRLALECGWGSKSSLIGVKSDLCGGIRKEPARAAGRERTWFEDVPCAALGAERSAAGRHPLVEEYLEVCKVPLVAFS